MRVDAWVMWVSLIYPAFYVIASIALATAAGLRLPVRLHWRELIVVSLATSGGFTFALFVAASVIPAGPLLNELKLGALSTIVGTVLALAAGILGYRIIRGGRGLCGSGPLSRW